MLRASFCPISTTLYSYTGVPDDKRTIKCCKPSGINTPLPTRPSLTKREIAFVLGAGAVLLLARLVIAASFELIPDEALYTLLASRAPLAWGSFPPGVLLLARLGMALGGKTELALRLPSVLLATSAVWPFYLLARELWNERAARYTLLCFAGVPVFSFFGGTLTPDGAQLCLWCWLLLWCWRALHTGTSRSWLMVGLLAGVGLWFKYPLALFWPSLLLALVLHPSWRSQWRGATIAFGVCCVMVLLPLMAQQGAGTQAMHYQLAQRQQWGAPRLGDFALWYGAHALYYSPLLYIACLAALWRGARPSHGDASLAFCFSFAVVTWALFAFVTTFTLRDLHREHWDALAYPPLILALPTLWRDVRSRWWRTVFRAVPAVAILCTLLTTLEAAIRLPSRALGKGPLFWHERGWRAMATETDRRLATMPPTTLIVGESFVNGAEYWFYGAHPARAYCLDAPYNARFGVAPALRNVGFVWPIPGKNQYRPVLSIGGPYSTPAELAQWSKALHKRGQIRDLPPLRVWLDGRLLKTFYYRSLPPF